MTRPPEIPDGIETDERRRRVGAAATKPCGRRDHLVEPDVDVLWLVGPSPGAPERVGGLPDQVRLIHRDTRRAALQRERPPARRERERVRQPDGLHERPHVMVAIGLPRAYAKHQIDLGRGPQYQSARHYGCFLHVPPRNSSRVMASAEAAPAGALNTDGGRASLRLTSLADTSSDADGSRPGIDRIHSLSGEFVVFQEYFTVKPSASEANVRQPSAPRFRNTRVSDVCTDTSPAWLPADVISNARVPQPERMDSNRSGGIATPRMASMMSLAAARTARFSRRSQSVACEGVPARTKIGWPENVAPI